MDKEIPKSELPKPFRKQSIRVSKSHLPGNTSYKGSVVWQRTLSIDDIAARVVDKRSEYRKERLLVPMTVLYANKLRPRLRFRGRRVGSHRLHPVHPYLSPL